MTVPQNDRRAALIILRYRCQGGTTKCTTNCPLPKPPANFPGPSASSSCPAWSPLGRQPVGMGGFTDRALVPPPPPPLRQPCHSCPTGEQSSVGDQCPSVIPAPVAPASPALTREGGAGGGLQGSNFGGQRCCPATRVGQRSRAALALALALALTDARESSARTREILRVGGVLDGTGRPLRRQPPRPAVNVRRQTAKRRGMGTDTGGHGRHSRDPDCRQ